ncbi:serine/arginine repetitive matrix protein 2-like [Canis lupus familiaris]|uniref:serine/arginine repetitive matrix protein 2-like n=1 Tax=Canis lupus familiaris TaxID=9615 RepID=UPI0018F4D368|nr:serine/arginine repetitive matrix protein 2-like [Canis lupus familiaris]
MGPDNYSLLCTQGRTAHSGAWRQGRPEPRARVYLYSLPGSPGGQGGARAPRQRIEQLLPLNARRPRVRAPGRRLREGQRPPVARRAPRAESRGRCLPSPSPTRSFGGAQRGLTRTEPGTSGPGVRRKRRRTRGPGRRQTQPGRGLPRRPEGPVGPGARSVQGRRSLLERGSLWTTPLKIQESKQEQHCSPPSRIRRSAGEANAQSGAGVRRPPITPSAPSDLISFNVSDCLRLTFVCRSRVGHPLC